MLKYIYKCPCCDGWGMRPPNVVESASIPPHITCPACVGKGVIWDIVPESTDNPTKKSDAP